MPSYPFPNARDGQSHTFDPACGRRVEHLLRVAGLTGVGTEGRAGIWHGGEAGGLAWQLTFWQLRDPMLATGLVDQADVDAVLDACDDPGFSFLSQVTVAAWAVRR